MAAKYFTLRQYAEENGISEKTARYRLERDVKNGLLKKRLVRKVNRGGLNCEKGPLKYRFPNRPAFAQYWKVDE